MRLAPRWMLTVFLLFGTVVDAQVTGRYVRLDAMAKFMELVELEVVSGGSNLLAGRPELITFGTGWGFYGPIDTLHSGKPRVQAQKITDGVKDTSERGIEIGPRDLTTENACLEADLGTERELERVTLHCSRFDAGPRKQWLQDPYGWRVLTVLDGNRKIVFSRLVSLYTPEYREQKGVMRVDLTGEAGALAGRHVPEQSLGWLSDADFLHAFFGTEVSEKPQAGPDPYAQMFAKRDSAEALDGLADTFLRRLDLNKPGLEAVRERAEAGDKQGALVAFKARFLQRLEYLDTLKLEGLKPRAYAFVAEPGSRSIVEADDLLEGRFADLKNQAIYHLPVGELGGLATALPARAPGVMGHRRVLLQAYAATGDKKYLDGWTRYSEEWALLYPPYADRNGGREYFPLQHMGGMLRYFKDLRTASAMQPALVEDLSPTALARVLMTCLEEYAPTYWRLARNTIFNHQFNIMPGAYFCSHVLNDFTVGQRFEREMQQQFLLLWTAAQTRDGSMIEVCDEGHVPGAMRSPASLYLHFLKHRPDWFDEFTEDYFLNEYRASARYLIRHTPPNGRLHRSRTDDNAFFYFLRQFMDVPQDELWRVASDFYTEAGPEKVSGPVFNEPEARAILDTVFGRGQADPPRDRKDSQACADVVDYYTGGYQGPPEMVSDYMPYAGIHYLRRGWQRSDSFIEMLCQPPGGSGNDRFMDNLGVGWYGSTDWDTRYHYFDYGRELLLARPLRIDDKGQYQQQANQGYKPGSKTERLVEAPEKPLPNRWLCHGNFDFAECFYQGAYQNRELVYDQKPAALQSGGATLVEEGEPLLDVHTTRQLVQLRAQRLFVAVDRVRPPDSQVHSYAARYLMQPNTATVPVETDAKDRRIAVLPADGPGLTLRQFGPRLSYTELTPRIQKRVRVEANWQAAGETVLVSLLAPSADATDTSVSQIVDISTPDCVGFEAACRDGSRLHYAAAARGQATLALAGLAVKAEMLLVIATERGVAGLVLGATSALARAGEDLQSGSPDFAFAEADGKLVVDAPILRPIDPPTIAPAANVFVDRQQITITSATPGVDLRYTLDGSEPTANSPLYTEPIPITDSCTVQARAFRKGVTTVPFTTAGTEASVISFGRFTKASLRPARRLTQPPSPGLAYDYLEADWLKLFAWGDELPATASGVLDHLFDVSMRQTDGPFALRCTGYLDVPAAGVYTFHAPYEYTHTTKEAGYDLRLIVDGEEWLPAQIWHGRGTWSIPLAEGPHDLSVIFADARAKDLVAQRCDYWRGYPSPWSVWKGTAPTIEVEGPRQPRGPIPDAWLKH